MPHQITIDSTAFQSMDDGDTAYYCGVINVVARDGRGKTVHCHGTDRDSVNCYDDVLAAALNLCGHANLDEYSDEYQDLMDEVQTLVDNKEVSELIIPDTLPTA